MSLLAMPPPAPFATKIAVAVLFLILTSLLAWKLYDKPITVFSVVVSIVVCLVSVVLIEKFIESDPGYISVIAGALSAAICLRPEKQSSDEEVGSSPPESRKRTHPLILGLIALFFGPILGCVFAFIYVSASEVHPKDVDDAFQTFLILGSIAGIVGGILITFLFWHKPNERQSESNQQSKIL